MTGHKDALYTLCSLDDTHFVSAGGDGMVVIWDLQDPETGKMIAQVPNSIYALCYHKQRNILIVGQNYSGIHLIDMTDHSEIGSLALTDGAIFDIQANDQYIFVACASGEVLRVSWELLLLGKMKLSEKSIRCLALSHDGNDLAVGSSDQMIHILDADVFQLKKQFSAHNISVFTLRYHPQFPLLISGSRDARFKVWNVKKDYEQTDEVVAHMYAINHLTFSPDSKYFATCSMDKSVKIWDAQSNKLLKVIDRARYGGHSTSVNKLLWMNYQDWLVSCSDDRTISVWDINFEGI